jgi:hypothetical protein
MRALGAALLTFALALAAETPALARVPAACAPQQTTAAALAPQPASRLPALQASRLQKEFNRAAGKVRVVAILSPSCPFCRRGYAVVASLLRQFRSDRLEAFIVWLPMLPGDSATQALAQSQELRDPRVAQSWDGREVTGKLFARTLGLDGIAWDVYLLYPDGVKWQGTLPPRPAFWMHQLSAASGADQRLCLNPARLRAELGKLLRGLQPASAPQAGSSRRPSRASAAQPPR